MIVRLGPTSAGVLLLLVALGYSQRIPEVKQSSQSSVCSNIVVVGNLTLNCTNLTVKERRIIDALPAQTREHLRNGLTDSEVSARLNGLQAAINALRREHAFDIGVATFPGAQPHFSAELYMDSSQGNDGRPRLVVENIGAGTARTIQCSFLSATGSYLSLLPEPITLLPHGKAEIEGFPTHGRKRPLDVSVDLTYVSGPLEGPQPYYSHFNFSVRNANLGERGILPNGIEEGVGVGHFSNNFREMMSVIGEPHGTVSLAVPEVDDNGRPNQISYWAGDKILRFDPAERKASFSVKFGKRFIVRTVPIKITGGVHILQISWDSKKGYSLLAIDGVIAGANRVPMQ